MKKILIDNKYLHNLCKREQEKNFRNKLKKIKSTYSLSTPKFLTLTKVAKDIIIKTKDKNSDNNNNKLYSSKLNSFKKSFSSNNLEKNIKTRFNNNELKLQMFTIAQNNLTMYQRLLEYSKKSSYDKTDLIKEYKKSQGYKKISCEYPSIDFFKNKRINNYYHSCSNKNSKLKTFFNNLDKYIRPQQNDINRNTYEKLFFSNDIRNEYIFQNKKHKLTLNNFNLDNTSRTFRKYFKTFSSINGKEDEKKNDIGKE